MPGPPDIPTLGTTTLSDVLDGSTWQDGPAYLALPENQWPFSREFLDTLPAEELRVPRAAFASVQAEPWVSCLGEKISFLVESVMMKSNCLSKVIHVTARTLKAVFSMARDRISEPLTVQDVEVARKVLFIVSMGPTLAAMGRGELNPLRPSLENGIVYVRSRCEKSLMELLGVSRLPVLLRQSRLARLIMIEAHCEDHRTTHTDVLARSRRRAWVVQGRYLAKEICKACPVCKLNKSKLCKQLMADIPEHSHFLTSHSISLGHT